MSAGLYFSQVIGPENPEAEFYKNWIEESCNAVQRATDTDGYISADCIDDVGKIIQTVDKDFASQRIKHDLDLVHTNCGPNSSHPYSKITLCRTVINVKDKLEKFPIFYEKFLVSYSYLDEAGRRRSCTTPIHSHPFNHEVVYFLKADPTIRVREQFYELISEGEDHASPCLDANKLRPKAVGLPEEIYPQSEPIILHETPIDKILKLNSMDVFQNSIFRAHQVTVEDGEFLPTLYFAINNYWSRTGKVHLFQEDTNSLWEANDWRGIPKHP